MVVDRLDAVLAKRCTGLVIVPIAALLLFAGGELLWGGGADSAPLLMSLGIAAFGALAMWGLGFALGIGGARLLGGRLRPRPGVRGAWFANFFALLAALMGLTDVVGSIVIR